jgi:hypothetical protein
MNAVQGFLQKYASVVAQTTIICLYAQIQEIKMPQTRIPRISKLIKMKLRIRRGIAVLLDTF